MPATAHIRSVQFVCHRTEKIGATRDSSLGKPVEKTLNNGNGKYIAYSCLVKP